MTPDKFQDLVDRLDKSLTDPEKEAVTGPFPDDPETIKEWNILSHALDAIRYNAIFKEVQAVRNELKPSSGSAIVRTIFTNNFMKVAAAVIVLISVAGLGKYLFTSPADVYNKYYTSYELGTTRGSESPDAVEQAYQVKDWSGVVRTFQSSGINTTGEDYFLTGMADMELKHYDLAIGLFNTLIQHNGNVKEPFFQDEAEYYLAMTYLAIGKSSLAIPLFHKIAADPDHLFNKEVRRMNALDMMILRAK